MKTTNTKRKAVETVVGAAVGAAIAGPAGAVVGGLVGRQAASHQPHEAEGAGSQANAKEIPEDPIIHAQLKRILVPLDFSPPSRRALRFTQEWATRFGSEICLLHVLEPIDTVGVFGAEPMLPPMPPVDFHAQARRELEKIAAQEFPDPARVSIHLRDGTAYDQIVIAAQELGADLIVVATHGRTGLAHALMGSTAERVVRHATCPVLTLRRARD